MRFLLLLLFLLPAVAHADGNSDPVRLAELMQKMVTQALAEPVGTNDAAAMGLLTDSLRPVTLGERDLLEARFLALRAEPRSDGGMVSRTTWVVDCAERSLAIRSLTSHADAATTDAIATQAWTDTEALAGLAVPGPDSLGRKMVDAACARDAATVQAPAR